MRVSVILSTILLLVGIPLYGQEKDQRAIDKRAFETRRKAAIAETWDAAIAILVRIDIDQIEDV